MKHKKSALFKSLVSLILCFSMLIGTTFAWFTDSVMTGINTIAAGNLDVELFHSNAAVSNEQVDSDTKLFMDLQGDPILWEPGVVSYENLRVVNEGSLALAYQMAINTANENFVVDSSGAQYGLSQILKVGVVEGGITATDRAGVVASVEEANWTSLANFLRSGKLLPEYAGESEKTWGVVIYWEPGENDNFWNLNNDKHLNEGDVLTIDLGIKLVATQEQHESDAFGGDYDAAAKLDVFPKFVVSVPVGAVDADNKLTESVKIGAGADSVGAVIPEGVKVEAGATQLTMEVKRTDRDANITMNQGEVSLSLDVHVDGIAADNDIPMFINLGAVLPTGLTAYNVQLYHVENGAPVKMEAVSEFTAHNQYIYDSNTGNLTINIKSFSEITAVVAAEDPWDGNTVDTSWYNTTDIEFTLTDGADLVGFAQIVGGMAEGLERDSFAGKTVKLSADINLGGHSFEPVGYYYIADNGDGKPYSDVYSFEGTFDGQDYTIANISQRTWDIKGDNPYYDVSVNHYYNDGMGLFGYVLNGTVKNLVIENFQSDGEFTMTGCVAAYAGGTSTFENIRLVGCNPRVYNTGNGGIVGYAESDSNLTFSDIIVDDSNKISALWGSWDVACAGILGRMADTAKVTMTNCTVAAQIDVYNDVCGNYQYYQYRYCGMLIGTAGSDNDPADQIANVTFKNCHVSYGDWAEYYYCELKANSQASYTHDYQFSRLGKIDRLDQIQSGTTWLKAGNFLLNGACYHIVDDNGTLNRHLHTDAGTESIDGVTVNVEDKVLVHIPFKQVYTGYGWGSSPSVEGVNVDEFLYSITYMYQGKVIGVEYIDDNGTAQPISTAYNAQVTPAGQTFKTWVTAGSVAFENNQIPAGNTKDIVLYPSYENIYTARWVDENGTVIYEQTFTNQTTALTDVAGPASSTDYLEFDHWEIRNADGTSVALSDYKFSSATGDITLYPYYNVLTGETASLGLTPVDSDGDGKPDSYTIEAVDAENIGTDVTIPGSINGVPVKVVTDLSGGWATSVENVVIQEGVEEINAQAFGDTQNLKTVELPSTITKIEDSAFAGDWSNISGIIGYNKVLTITYNGTKADWDQVVANSNQDDSEWEDGLAEGTTVICTDGTYTLTEKEQDGGWFLDPQYAYTWTWTANSTT